MLEFTDKVKELLRNTANRLKGSDRRMFMAETAEQLGRGGISIASRELGWNRGTIGKGKRELKEGPIADNFSARGRKKAEEILPNLFNDIKMIVEPESQTDPSFHSSRVYTRLSAPEVRKRLLERGYTERELPSERTINTKLNDLKYNLKKVQKTKPKKKIPETDAIFDQIGEANRQADAAPNEIRISIDAKARMNIGNFSRGGRNRVLTQAEDHDLGVKTKMTPFGFFLPQYDDLYLFFTESYASSDFIVDRLDEVWGEIMKKYSSPDILTINADNGMENSSQRTQFIKRMVEFSQKHQITIKLAYYPPYHSKYNPIERVWGIYENHINGDMMDTVETTLKFAESMTYNGKPPIVKLIDQVYQTGVKVAKEGMEKYNKFVERLPKLEKWFLTISPIAIE